VAFPVVRVCVAVGGLVRGQWLFLLFDACAVTCGRSFTVLSVWGDLISFRSVLVFSPALLSLLFLLPYYIIIISIVVVIIIGFYCYHYFHGASGSV